MFCVSHCLVVDHDDYEIKTGKRLKSESYGNTAVFKKAVNNFPLSVFLHLSIPLPFQKGRERLVS